MTIPDPLSIETRDEGESVRLAVVGELDLATAPAFEAAIEAQRERGRDLVLDLAGLEFVDSTGLRVILEAVQTAQGDGRRLTIRRDLTAPVQRAFKVTGLLELLPLE